MKMTQASDWVQICCDACVSKVPNPMCHKCEGTGIMYRCEYWVGGGSTPLVKARHDRPFGPYQNHTRIDTPTGTFDMNGREIVL